MSSTTDELRALLDDAGVEHEDPSPDHTNWGPNASGWYDYNAGEDVRGILNLHMWGITPAQAVEATLNTLPHFWTADNVLHLQPRRMPTSIHVECGGEVVEMEPWRGTYELEAENATLREFATRAYKMLTSAHPYSPQQVAEWYDTLEWIDQTARKLGIEVEP